MARCRNPQLAASPRLFTCIIRCISSAREAIEDSRAAEDLRSILTRLIVTAICGQKRSYNSEKQLETLTRNFATGSLRPSPRLWSDVQGYLSFNERDGARAWCTFWRHTFYAN
jgi:hypothetical protein